MQFLCPNESRLIAKIDQTQFETDQIQTVFDHIQTDQR